MLELDHVIWCVPARDAAELTGFTVEAGRVHAGQGTRNVRVMFDRNYLEVLWVEDAAQVAARGLDFVERCARPARAVPFGCVLRGAIAEEDRPRFTPYELPDAPGVVLQLLAAQAPDAPFLAVFETGDLAGRWPARVVAASDLVHACGARHIARAVFTSPARPPIGEVAGVAFASGPPGLALELGGIVRTFDS